MPRHQERVRKNYECPSCGGTGKQDDYEGEYECYECGGAGIILAPKPQPRRGSLAAAFKFVIDDAVRAVSKECGLSMRLIREYDVAKDVRPNVGATIAIHTPKRFEEPR